MKLVLVLVLSLLSCGPSNVQIKAARTALYVVEPRELFRIALEVTQQRYKVGEQNEASLVFATKPLMFSSEGEPQSLTDGVVHKGPFSIGLALVVEIVEVVDVGQTRHAVTVTPRTLKFRSNNSAPQELKPDDIDLPAFVTARVENLAVEIYDRAKMHTSK